VLRSLLTPFTCYFTFKQKSWVPETVFTLRSAFRSSQNCVLLYKHDVVFVVTDRCPKRRSSEAYKANEAGKLWPDKNRTRVGGMTLCHRNKCTRSAVASHPLQVAERRGTSWRASNPRRGHVEFTCLWSISVSKLLHYILTWPYLKLVDQQQIKNVILFQRGLTFLKNGHLRYSYHEFKIAWQLLLKEMCNDYSTTCSGLGCLQRISPVMQAVKTLIRSFGTDIRIQFSDCISILSSLVVNPILVLLSLLLLLLLLLLFYFFFQVCSFICF
jgi:hypothetical protein